MSTEYKRATTDAELKQLAHKIEKMRNDGVPWDGPGGIVAQGLVSSATRGRALLRKYRLDAAQGGSVEIRDSYDRYEINPKTGQRKGYRRPAPRPAAKRVDAGAYRPTDSTHRQTVGQKSAPSAAVPSPSIADGLGRSADPLMAFVRQIAQETGRNVPTPNPDGPTTRALALFVLRDPGATATSGANETGVLDPYLNRDPTSRRQQTALRVAEIDPDVCVWWNASPYHLGYKGKIRERDCDVGAHYLRGFIERCPELRVVVAMGEAACAVATRVWRDVGTTLPPLIVAPHPMIYGRGSAERSITLMTRLREARDLIRGTDHPATVDQD